MSSHAAPRSADDARCFEAPLLRPLDERARGELRAAGAIRSFDLGATLYREGDVADTFWIVLDGTVGLHAPEGARGGARVVRRAHRFGTFGEEASELGARRVSRAVAETSGRAFEIPMAGYRRALTRLGQEAVLEREVRAFRRTDLCDRLRLLGLAERRRTLEILLDTGRLVRPEPGEFLVVAGERAKCGFLVLAGQVELLSAGERPRVTAYVAPGDVFAHREAVSGTSHPRSVVPLGSALLLELPPEALQELEALDPEWIERADRHGGVAAELGVWLDRAQRRRTRLALAELPRLTEARSLLSIDLDRCVRCGHCSVSCASAHEGISRLDRSGEKVASVAARGERSLLLPSSCHHCKRPSCLPECPTGAIGRGADGEVFVREELCTGCGACERACPWQNIKLVPRADGSTVATKCDLCAGSETPACVAACPTSAITRGAPEQAFVELGRLKGASEAPALEAPSRISTALCAGFALVAVALCVLSARTASSPGHATGAAAGVLILALMFQGVRKRLRRRGAVNQALSLHRALSLLAPAAVTIHGGLSWGTGVSGALSVSFWGSMLLGVATALAYHCLPRRLTRLEREIVSPERDAAERARLDDRLHLAISSSGRSARRVFEHVLVPYLRSPLVTVSLLTSGRSLADEERRLAERVRCALSDHAAAELQNLDALIGATVERAAHPARRLLAGALRALGMLHLILAAVLLVLLLVHVIGVVR